MTYIIRHRYNGIDIIDPDDNSATYVRINDIPDLIDQLKDAYDEARRQEGVSAADIPDWQMERLLKE